MHAAGPFQGARIRDSNKSMLLAAVLEAGGEAVDAGISRDTYGDMGIARAGGPRARMGSSELAWARMGSCQLTLVPLRPLWGNRRHGNMA
jgi:hypothetical protein